MSNTIIWTTSIRKLSDLKDLPDNPRRITEDAFKRLKERIQKRGFHDVIKLDIENFILSGNQRSRALKELGIEEVNVLIPNRTLLRSERDAIIVESNRSDGTFDFDMLGNMFEPLDLKELGFTDLELGLDSFEVTQHTNEQHEPEEIECPHCHKTFEK